MMTTLNILEKAARSSSEMGWHDRMKAITGVERLDGNLYRGSGLWVPKGTRGAYGGHVIAQTLAAANQTITDDKNRVHSVHCYFLRPGSADIPVIYRVNRIQDDPYFSSRAVTASQNGKPILTLQASYHNESMEKSEVTRKALSYSSSMPIVPHHSRLKSYDEILRYKPNYAESDHQPMEIKPVNPDVYFRKVAASESKLWLWIRCRASIEDDQNLNRCCIAFMSDWAIAKVAMVQHLNFKAGMVTSLDHSIWFHHPVKADEWMLYEREASIAENCKGLVLGKLYKEDGTLAVTVAQQCLIRPHVSESKL